MTEQQAPPTAVRVVDNPELSRFEGYVGEELAGIVEYIAGEGLIKATHTIVLDEFEGRGVGAQLVGGMLEQLRAEGRGLIPSCSYVRKFLSRHAEYADLVAAAP